MQLAKSGFEKSCMPRPYHSNTIRCYGKGVAYTVWRGKVEEGGVKVEGGFSIFQM